MGRSESGVKPGAGSLWGWGGERGEEGWPFQVSPSKSAGGALAAWPLPPERDRIFSVRVGNFLPVTSSKVYLSNFENIPIL